MNSELPYYYDADVEWKGERRGELTSPGLPAIEVAPPPEFKGVDGVWTPEHLYVASVNVCFLATVVGISANSNLELVSFTSSSRGRLEKIEGQGLIITEITIKPRLVVKSDRDIERALRIIDKAHKTCLVANSVKTAVRIEPEVTAGA